MTNPKLTERLMLVKMANSTRRFELLATASLGEAVVLALRINLTAEGQGDHISELTLTDYGKADRLPDGGYVLTTSPSHPHYPSDTIEVANAAAAIVVLAGIQTPDGTPLTQTPHEDTRP